MSDSENAFSNYGIYDVDEGLDLFLPHTEIKIERVGKNAFSYFRKNSDGKIIEKMIVVKICEINNSKTENSPKKRKNKLHSTSMDVNI